MAKHVRVELMYTESIQDQGVNYNVSFIILADITDPQDPQSDRREWHYYGVLEADRPRTSLEPRYADVPFFEHATVDFPSDFQHLPDEEMFKLYPVAAAAGIQREGV